LKGTGPGCYARAVSADEGSIVKRRLVLLAIVALVAAAGSGAAADRVGPGGTLDKTQGYKDGG
jgi:hypothetical protein